MYSVDDSVVNLFDGMTIRPIPGGQVVNLAFFRYVKGVTAYIVILIQVCTISSPLIFFELLLRAQCPMSFVCLLVRVTWPLLSAHRLGISFSGVFPGCVSSVFQYSTICA